MNGGPFIKNAERDFLYMGQASADIYGAEAKSGAKPTICRPMNPEREQAAYAGVVREDGMTAKSSNVYKARKGACQRCNILYRWRGIPTLRESLCRECGELLKHIVNITGYMVIDSAPQQARQRDARHGACCECKSVYSWLGLPLQQDAACPECGCSLKAVRPERKHWRRIILTPQRKDRT